MLNYRLQVFKTVAELQSTTKAARALHLSQPAVTKHIQMLEADLGVPLFVRSAKGMILNESGLLFLQHTLRIASAENDIIQHLRAPTGFIAGRLRIGSNKTILAYCLPEILARFKKRYPSAICEIIDGNTDTIVGALLDERIDLALIEGPCRRPEIQSRAFLEDEIIWIASPNDPVAQLPYPSLNQILERPIIVREVGAGSRQFMEGALRQMRVRLDRLNVVQEIASPEAIKRLVASGLGISYVFKIGVQPELANGSLRQINCSKLTVRRPFSLLLPQGPSPTGLAQEFIHALMNKAG